MKQRLEKLLGILRFLLNSCCFIRAKIYASQLWCWPVWFWKGSHSSVSKYPLKQNLSSPLASVLLLCCLFLFSTGCTLFVRLFFPCFTLSSFDFPLSDSPSVLCQPSFLLFQVFLLDRFSCFSANGVLLPKNFPKKSSKSLGSALLISL